MHAPLLILKLSYSDAVDRQEVGSILYLYKISLFLLLPKMMSPLHEAQYLQSSAQKLLPLFLRDAGQDPALIDVEKKHRIGIHLVTLQIEVGRCASQ